MATNNTQTNIILVHGAWSDASAWSKVLLNLQKTEHRVIAVHLQENSLAVETPSFKRNYDAAFGKVSDILRSYGIGENPRNLRFRFTLCMQEFFDSIPQDQWKLNDPAFIKQSEVFAITKFREWIIEQIT